MEDKILDIMLDITGEEGIRDDIEVDLFEAGLMDSLSLVTLMVELEEAFDLVISPSEYEREDFSTVHKIIGIVSDKVHEKQ